MQRFNCFQYMCGAVLLAFGAVAWAAPAVTEITLPGTLVFPESITSTSDGTLIVGSLGHGNILRIAPGKNVATEWIKPGAGGLNDVALGCATPVDVAHCDACLSSHVNVPCRRRMVG